MVSDVRRTYTVNIEGIEINKNQFYCIDFVENLPVFTKVQEIFIIDDYPIIISNNFKTKCFNKNFYSFDVKQSEELILLKPEKLICYKSFKSFTHKKSLFISKTYEFHK
jgi:hypothetical protein